MEWYRTTLLHSYKCVVRFLVVDSRLHKFGVLNLRTVASPKMVLNCYLGPRLQANLRYMQQRDYDHLLLFLKLSFKISL